MEHSTVPTRQQRKARVGIVTSNKMTKTIVVRVDRLVRHPKYNRVVRHASSFKVHDERNSASVGDRVRIMETRPLSKDKRWRLVEILKRASSAPPVPEEQLGQAQAVTPSTPGPVSTANAERPTA